MIAEDERKIEEILRDGDFYVGGRPMVCTYGTPVQVGGREYWPATAWGLFPIGQPNISGEVMKDKLRHSRRFIRDQILAASNLVEVKYICQNCTYCSDNQVSVKTRFWDALMFLFVKERGADNSKTKSVALVADGGTVYPVFGLVNVITGQVVGKVANLYTNQFETVPAGTTIRDVVEHNLHYSEWIKTALAELPT